MLSPLRIIFSDTCTGETGWVDVPEAEFSIESVIKAITTEMSGDDDEPYEPLTPISWTLTRWGGTACYIIGLQGELIHGVCYTRFDKNHDPMR